MGYQDNGNVATDPLIAWMDAGDRQSLRLASEAEAAASLRRLMGEQESMAPDIDGERLARAIWALESAEKWVAAAVAMAWLKERPSGTRLDVVLGVLVVSWNRAPGTPPPDPVLVEELLSVHDGLPRDVTTENTLLIVLIRAIQAGLPAPLAARVRRILEHASEVPDRQPEVREILDAFLNTPPG